MNFFNFFSSLGNEIALFIISMIPIVELRGAIPLGASLGIEWYKVFAISVVGNLIPVPFLILFGGVIFNWFKNIKIFSKFFETYEKKILKKSEKVAQYSLLGLTAFVAIPLPGTGAWTGSLIAVVLNLKFKNAFLSIVLGVLIAGVIMTIGSYGIVSVFNFFSK